MPIIDRAALKIHIGNLALRYIDPKDFIMDFHVLVDEHNNRTKKSTLKNSHHDKKPDTLVANIINQIANELSPQINNDPTMGTILIYSLWEDASLEARILSSRLIGMLDPKNALDILCHLPDWLCLTSSKFVYDSFMNYPFKRLRREKQSRFLHLLEGWLSSPNVTLQMLGIRVLIPLLDEPCVEDIPTIFRIVKPSFLEVNSQSQKEVQRCIASLGKISADETLFFLKELLSENHHFSEYLKRMLPGFPTEFQDKVRNIIYTD